jgi:lysine 2,3-aminomutase
MSLGEPILGDREDIPKTNMRHLRPMRGRFTHHRVRELMQLIYTPEEFAEMQAAGVDKRMMFGTNPHYQALIMGEELCDTDGNVLVPEMPPSKAIAALVLPRLHETFSMDGAKDPSNQMNFTPGSNSLRGKLLHKYDEIVLGYASPTCSAHCRYCYRLDLFNKDTGKISIRPEELRDYILNYNERLETNKGIDPNTGERRYPIRETLLSGGDIMVLPNRTLYKFASAAGQAKVNLLRFGTKEIAFRPERFDEAMAKTFRIINSEYPHMHMNIVTHYTHPDEFLERDMNGNYIPNANGPGYKWLDVAKQAVERFTSMSFVTLENQTPIIQKVNDDEPSLRILHEELRRMGIKLKYIFQGRDIEGHKAFSLPVEEAWKIHNSTMKGLSDTARSRFSLSTEWGKMEVVSVIDPLTEECKDFDFLPPVLQNALLEVLGEGLVIFKSHRSPYEASSQGDLIIAKRNPEALWISGYEDRILYDTRKDANNKYAGLVALFLEGMGGQYLEKFRNNKMGREILEKLKLADAA